MDRTRSSRPPRAWHAFPGTSRLRSSTPPPAGAQAILSRDRSTNNEPPGSTGESKWSLQEEQNDEREQRAGQDVPGPWTHVVEEAGVQRPLPQVEVVTAGHQVHERVGQAQRQGQAEYLRHGAGPRRAAEADSEEEGSRDDAPVRQVELPVRIGGEVLPEVRGQQRLQRAPESPEVGQLAQDRPGPEQGHAGEQP